MCEPTPKLVRVLDWSWFLAWALGSSVWCLTAAWELGATFDEPTYLRAGLTCWREGIHAPLLRLGTMPLPADLASLPLYIFERATGAQFDFTYGDHSVPLFWARTTTLSFWWLLLFYARLVGRHLAGPWAGRWAVALIACEPNFLAHASLATTDIAAAACLLPTIYYFAAGRAKGWWRRVCVPGLWFGLALFAKASALAFVPLGWLAVELHRCCLMSRAAPWDADVPSECASIRRGLFRGYLRDSFAAGGIGLLFVCLLVGSDWTTEGSLVRWAESLPSGATRDWMLPLAENLRIFPNAGNGLLYQIRHNLHGHSTYLLGHSDARCMWYYYPVLLAIKLPLPILLLPLALLVLKPRALLNWACMLGAGFVIFSTVCRVQIGIRLMLPWLAIGLVGLAAATVTACREPARSWRPQAVWVVCGFGLCWLVMSAMRVRPHGLTYVNEVASNHSEAYRMVSDSNYDWGQGLKELARWQEEHGVVDLDVWYLGTDPAITDLPVRQLSFDNVTVQEMCNLVAGRSLAVSATLLYGSYAKKAADVVAHLRQMGPTARTQTFLIFDFTNQKPLAKHLAE